MHCVTTKISTIGLLHLPIDSIRLFRKCCTDVCADRPPDLLTAMLYQLGLCVVAFIQLTSSQSTGNDDQQSCGCSQEVLRQLMTLTNAMSQLQMDVAELKDERNENQLMNAVTQLQRDISELKDEQALQLINATWQLRRDVVELKDEQDLNQLMMLNSQLMNATSQLQRDVAELKAEQNLTQLMVTMNNYYQQQTSMSISQLRTSVTNLQGDVTEVKTGSRRKNRNGKLLRP